MFPIPANATRIRYLESTGTQYVDTGIYYATPIEFQADVSVTKIEGYNCVFGCSTVTNRFFLGISNAGKISLGMGGGIAEQNFAQSIVLGQRYLFRYQLASRRQVWQDGTSLWSGALQPAPSNVSIWAFGSRRGPSESEAYMRSSDGWKGRIYSLKIMQGAGYPPVRDFIPVRVGQTGYLFDRVSGELFGNAGTGSFVLGPDTFAHGVVPTRMMAMGVRKKALRYLRSTGTYYTSREVSANGSYINTNINPDSQTIVEIVCRVTPGSTFQHWTYLLGSQTTNDNANTFSVRGLSTSQVSPPWRNYRWGHTSWQDFGITTDSWSGSSDWHTISINRSGLVLDGVLYSATGTTNTSVPGKPIFIGCINRNGTAQNCIPLDIASLKIWNGSVLQFDGKPEVVNGVAGLKDSVSGSLFSSSSASNPYQLLQEPAS